MLDTSATERFGSDLSAIAKNEATAAAEIPRAIPDHALNTADNRVTPEVDTPRVIPAHFASVRQLVSQAEQPVPERATAEITVAAINLGANIEEFRRYAA